MTPTIDVNKELKESSTFIYNANGESQTWEETSLKELSSHSSTKITRRSNGNSVHTHGDFHGLSGVLSFSGTENNGGPHGSAEIQLSPGTGTAHVILETSSVVIVSVDGEDGAVYGGVITEVIENTIPPPPPPPPPPPGVPPPPPPACQPLDLGTFVYFLVKDNGQGNNAPADEYRSVLVARCDEYVEGGAEFPWDFFLFAWSEVEEESDEIKVNY